MWLFTSPPLKIGRPPGLDPELLPEFCIPLNERFSKIYDFVFKSVMISSTTRIWWYIAIVLINTPKRLWTKATDNDDFCNMFLYFTYFTNIIGTIFCNLVFCNGRVVDFLCLKVNKHTNIDFRYLVNTYLLVPQKCSVESSINDEVHQKITFNATHIVVISLKKSESITQIVKLIYGQLRPSSL